MKKLIFSTCFARNMLLLVLASVAPYLASSQSMNCGFDELFEENMYNGSSFYQDFYENEEIIIDAMNNPQMLALLNGSSSYTIPVVVHVMHLGESEGFGSNISNSLIIQAIDDLNADFANGSGNGVDIGIQFCLAQRTPDNQSTDGIVRVNAAAICAGGSCFGSGMTVGGPLAYAVKSASIWPNDDYINIWVVHSITGALGYATFPNTSSAIDGIVVDKDYFGVNGTNVLAHETGHFFNLFHTFQGDCPVGVNCNQNCATVTICPPNTPCDNDPSNDQDEICCRVQGDRVCDTPPHKRSCSSCLPAGTNSCDNNSSNSLFVHNYMDYSTLSCMDRFTDGQKVRMRFALMELRSPLMNSLGCDTTCTDVITSFDGPEDGMEGETLCFNNTSTGATNYNWQLNNESQSNSANFCFDFDIPGIYELCLISTDSICTNKVCKSVVIISIADHCDFSLPECQALANGNFSDVEPDSSFHNPDYTFNRVCNWYNRTGSPSFHVNDDLGNAWIYFINDSNRESIGTTSEVELIAGFEYELSFEYSILTWVHNQKILPFMQVGLSQTLLEGNSNTVIWEIEKPANDVFIDSYPGDSIETVHRVDTCFTYTADMGKFLYFDGVSNGTNNQIVVRNVAINSCACDGSICNPNPEIMFTQDSCSFAFEAINEGDPGDCHWNYGDGTSDDSCSVVHEYIFGGTFNVCLTITCDDYVQETVCDSITVPEYCEHCEDITPNAVATKCDDNEAGSYMTKVDFPVPNGTTPCDDELFVWSNDAFVSVTSFEIEDFSSTNDLVVACFNLTPYDGVDLEAQSTPVYVTLCDSLGNMVCYTFDVSAAACKTCLGELTATAECIDPNPFDDTYIYEGSITINLPINGGPYTECDPVSTEVGYEQEPDIVGNVVTVEFSINTETEGDFNASSLLCFDGENIGQVCYTLNIEIIPCEDPECIDWDDKVSKAKNCTVSNGQVTYTVAMTNVWLFGSGYTDCGTGLTTMLDGSDSITLNNGSITNNGSDLNYSVSITMPCGFDTSQLYELIFIACDGAGNPVCISFNIQFPDCDADCDVRDDDGPKGRSAIKDINEDLLQVYPNPARNEVVLSIENATSKQHNVLILDQLGRKVLGTQFLQNVQLDISKLQSGLHFIKVIDNSGNIIGFEKLIILK